jgi:PadR family transcriptional regulator, regulatory protein AphA
VPRDLNTTSFALLALLAIRPWTTYELATQMDRSLRWFWPRAASVLYTEPKKLVRLGLATATREFTGRRPRTVYAITDTGRQALGRWLDQPGGGPILEFEALTQIAFADLGTRDQLLRTIGTVRADAVTRHDEALARIREYAETGGPFPERLPVIALVARLLLEYTELLTRWAAWADAEVEGWAGTTATDGARVPDAVFEPSSRPTRRPETPSRPSRRGRRSRAGGLSAPPPI